MAFTCPHCGQRGISVIAKLISSGATYWGWSATCRLCGQRSRVAGAAVHLQFLMFVGALASLPWLLEGDARMVAGYLIAAAILAVGLVAPLKKDLLS